MNLNLFLGPIRTSAAKCPSEAVVINNNIFKTPATRVVEEVILENAKGDDYIHCLDTPEIFTKNFYYFNDPKTIFSDHDRHWTPDAKFLVAKEIAEFVNKDILRNGNITSPEYSYLKRSLSFQAKSGSPGLLDTIEQMMLYEQKPSITDMKYIISCVKEYENAKRLLLAGSGKQIIGFLVFKNGQEERKLFEYFSNFLKGWIKANNYSLPE